MARSTTVYVCSSCGAQTRQFFGRCSSCGSWNTLVEQLQAAEPAADSRRRRPVAAEPDAAPRPRRSASIRAVGERPLQRLASGYGEFDRVLGGGLVPGSLVLLGGDPGIGKSTLLLQSGRSMAERCSVLYVSSGKASSCTCSAAARAATASSRSRFSATAAAVAARPVPCQRARRMPAPAAGGCGRV